MYRVKLLQQQRVCLVWWLTGVGSWGAWAGIIQRTSWSKSQNALLQPESAAGPTWCGRRTASTTWNVSGLSTLKVSLSCCNKLRWRTCCWRASQTEIKIEYKCIYIMTSQAHIWGQSISCETYSIALTWNAVQGKEKLLRQLSSRRSSLRCSCTKWKTASIVSTFRWEYCEKTTLAHVRFVFHSLPKVS